MKATITNHTTGETITINRDVTHAHPVWVHEQLGTESESDLQALMDQYNLHDYYSVGRHLPADAYGVVLTADDDDWTYQLRDSGGVTESADTLEDAAEIAAEWYETSVPADLDASSIESLQASIAAWENRVAESDGHHAVAGHGSYYVSPSSAAGMNLRVERILRGAK